jgi:hypothetical protein
MVSRHTLVDQKQAFTDKEGFISKHGQELYDAVILLRKDF